MLTTRRRLAGMLAAACAPALIVGSYGAITGSLHHFPLFFVATFIVAALHVCLVAMPVFGVLSRLWRPRLWNILPASFLTGAMPFLLWSLGGPLVDEETSGDRVLVLHGAWTQDGWLVQLQSDAMLGALGLSGGLAFWLVVNRPWRSGSCR